MPKPEEYAEASAWLESAEGLEYASADEVRGLAVGEFDPDGGRERAAAQHEANAAHATLALRWLRVGAAMEAGAVTCIKPWRTGRPDEQWSAINAKDETFYEADPLTAAERAMGVGT